MTFIIMLIITVAAVELVIDLRFFQEAGKLSRVARKTWRVIGSRRISDHWKEKAILAYAISLLLSSLKLTGTIAAILFAAAVPILIYMKVADVGDAFLSALMGWDALIVSVVGAVLYYRLRRRYGGS